jgi:hypothetical protein
MLRRAVCWFCLLTAIDASAADYRGMAPGWPGYANGYYAAYYPQNHGAGPSYYVARPVVAAAYGGNPATAAAYMPVTTAYANPTYFAAYGASPNQLRAPAANTAYYAGGQPMVAYYPPTTANYAPAHSYAVSPAGAMASGAEAATYYGQPYRTNYVPPRFAYRTNYATVPVYMYRPVTAYQPATGQPVTCLQATTTSECQPRRTHSWFAWLNPFNWFHHDRCGSGGCGPAPVPTTAYCGPAPCGQPYYPTTPTTVIPTVPITPSVTAPSTTIVAPPTNVIPTYPGSTIGVPRVPPPPTRTFPGATAPGTTFPSTGVPADTRPSLTPPAGTSTGGAVTIPGIDRTFPPGTIVTPLPSDTTPGSTQPGATQPGSTSPGSFPTNPSSGGFGSGYAPGSDPYRGSSLGSSYQRSSARRPSEPSRPAADDGVIRAPDLGPALPPNVTTVPDVDAVQPPPPSNAAPPLIDSRDKLAAAVNSRWAVVPAVWPKTAHLARQAVERTLVETKAFEPSSEPIQFEQPRMQSPYAAAAAAAAHAAQYDDGGWTSGRGW